ncbi:hypothetical protein Trydic_g12886 [Trypoxylus dichotomus]
MISEKSSIEKIIEEINSTNAKKVAALLVIAFACYHEFLHIRYGSNSCSWLLSDGRYKGDKQWQPYGCMLHHYSKIDTRRCLRYIAYYGKNTHFVFIGDSRIKTLYEGFIGHLKQDDATTAKPENTEHNLIHIDRTLKLTVEFKWFPYISKSMVDQFRNWLVLEKPPSVIVAGCGLWSIKTSNGSEAIIQEYSLNLTRLVQPIDHLRERKSTILWALQEPVNTNKISSEYQMVTNEYIDLYNEAAAEVLSYSSAEVWWSARLVASGMVSESPDGIHLASRPLQHDTQILLNMYCNDYMNFNDGSCCSSAESYTILQLVTFSILAVCVVVMVIMFLYRWLHQLKGRSVQEYILLSEVEGAAPHEVGDHYTLFKALSTMAIIMAYFIICDRTNFFMKENKYYSEFSFWIPVGYVFTLGFFFTENSKYTKVLHPDQMNEWKGWMQEFDALVTNQQGKSMKVLRVGRGAEFLNENLKTYLKKKGIRLEEAPYTPQQNRKIERDNRTIMESARSMLAKKNVPLFLWAEAVNTAVYVRNRACFNRKKLSPYESWTGKRPKLSHPKIFGVEAFKHMPDQFRRKLESKSKIMTLVGYQDHEIIDCMIQGLRREEQDANEPNEIITTEGTTLKERLRDRKKLKKPLRYEEFEANVVGCESNCYQQAVTGPDSEKWRRAIQEELEVHEKNETWTIVPRNETKVIGFSRSIPPVQRLNSRQDCVQEGLINNME